MKRIAAFTLAFVLALGLAACGTKAPASGSTSSAPSAPKDYVQIITDAREADFNEAFQIVHGKTGEETTMGGTAGESNQGMIDMIMGMVGLDAASCDEYAVSVSLMNVHAYGVGIFKPAEGKKQAVLDAVNGFVAAQQKAQETFLPDQYEIAKAAIVKEVPSGEIILVMSENAEDVASKIENGLK